MKFLIVDDDFTICEGTARRLRAMQNKAIEDIFCAFSAQEALALLNTERIDVMITDIRMDGMDGLTLISLAKQLHPNMICVVVSAYSTFQYAQTAIRVGVEDFLVKPCSESTMRSLMEQIITRFTARLSMRRRLLDLALEECMHGGEQNLHDCFAQAGETLPNAPLHLAVWRKRDYQVDQAPSGIWFYQPIGKQYLLAGTSGTDAAALLAWLEGLSQTLQRPIGVSLPGYTLIDMACQASVALRSSWYYETPHVHYFTENAAGNTAHPSESIAQQIHALHTHAVKQQFIHLAQSCPEDPQPLCAVFIAMKSELNNLYTALSMKAPDLPSLTEPLGWNAMLDAFTGALEQVRSIMIDPAKLDPITFARRYVDQHLSEPINMAVLANTLNVSYTYFSKLFRERVGSSFSEYVQSRRMAEACRLLRLGDRITDIAERLGYQNTNNFTRAFTKTYGMPPRQFRADGP